VKIVTRFKIVQFTRIVNKRLVRVNKRVPAVSVSWMMMRGYIVVSWMTMRGYIVIGVKEWSTLVIPCGSMGYTHVGSHMVMIIPLAMMLRIIDMVVHSRSLRKE